MDKSKREKKTCTLIMEEEGLNYKEILTKTKQNVRNEEECIKIRNVKQARKGKLS